MGMDIRIPLDWPNIGELEKSYVLRALDSGFVSSAGPLVAEFEQEFAAYVGAKHAVATVNGTAGLHLALRLLGIGPGDEVIVPALTFIATVNPVVYVGARPVVVDVDLETWNIDPEAVERAITPRTRAIIPVHLYGNPADMFSLREITQSRGIHLVEDATEALGSAIGGQHVGTFGEIGVFSFNGNKVITTGGGGMLVTNDVALAERARLLVNQGRPNGLTEYKHQEIGYNYRLTNLQAAMGLAQLDRLDEFLGKKKENALQYQKILKDVPGLKWQLELPGGGSNWWMFSIVVDECVYGIDRHILLGNLLSLGIQARPLFMPINLQPSYASYGLRDCPNAELLHHRGLNIPNSTLLTMDQVIYVAESIKSFAQEWGVE